MADTARPDRLDPTAIDERRRRVAQLYLARRTQTEIAQALAVAQSTVSGDLAALRRQWQREAVVDVESALLREAAELDTLEAQAAARFAATQEVVWILARLKCKAQRAALLGLNKHRLELSGPGGQPLLFREVVIELPSPREPSSSSELPPPPEPGAAEPALALAVPPMLASPSNGNGFLEVVVDLPR